MADAAPRALRHGALLLGALALAALLAPWLAPHGPLAQDLDRSMTAPSGAHWMGTDDLGRDLAARVLYGGRVSLQVGLLSAALALAIGLPLGALAGSAGGWVDAGISRLVEAVLCLPTLVLVLALLAVAPPWLEALPPVARVAAVLGATGWVPVARYLRGEFLRLSGTEMVLAARAAGGGPLRVALRHVAPSALAPVLVTTSFAVGAAILLEATLSFLGLGLPPPTPSWGILLAEAREQVGRGWWLALFPGLALFATVLGCTMVGDGLRALLDPRDGRR